MKKNRIQKLITLGCGMMLLASLVGCGNKADPASMEGNREEGNSEEVERVASSDEEADLSKWLGTYTMENGASIEVKGKSSCPVSYEGSTKAGSVRGVYDLGDGVLELEVRDFEDYAFHLVYDPGKEAGQQLTCTMYDAKNTTEIIFESLVVSSDSTFGSAATQQATTDGSSEETNKGANLDHLLGEYYYDDRVAVDKLVLEKSGENYVFLFTIEGNSFLQYEEIPKGEYRVEVSPSEITGSETLFFFESELEEKPFSVIIGSGPAFDRIDFGMRFTRMNQKNWFSGMVGTYYDSYGDDYKASFDVDKNGKVTYVEGDVTYTGQLSETVSQFPYTFVEITEGKPGYYFKITPEIDFGVLEVTIFDENKEYTGDGYMFGRPIE